MTPEEARALLGVRAGADADEVRHAFRRLVREHHPDIAGDTSGAHVTTARLTDAYRILREAPTPAGRPASWPEDIDTVAVAGSGAAIFHEVREAAEMIGTISYVGPSDHILEVLVDREGWSPAALVVTLEEAGGATLARCTLEALDGGPGPPIGEVVADLHRALRLVRGPDPPT